MKMDKKSSTKSKINVHSVPKKSENGALSQSRLPVRITPNKKEVDTVNTNNVKASKLPMRKTTNSVITKKVESKSLTSQKSNQSKNCKEIEDVQPMIVESKIEHQPLDSNGSHDKIYTSSYLAEKIKALSTALEYKSEIKNITSETENFVAKKLTYLNIVGEIPVECFIKSVTPIHKIELQNFQYSEEELTKFIALNATINEKLEHQINECIHNIQSSALEILEENQTHTLANVEVQINECIEEIFKFKVDYPIYKYFLNEEISLRPLVTATSDIIKISSNFKIFSINKVKSIVQLCEQISFTAIKNLQKSRSTLKINNSKISQSIFTVQSEIESNLLRGIESSSVLSLTTLDTIMAVREEIHETNSYNVVACLSDESISEILKIEVEDTLSSRKRVFPNTEDTEQVNLTINQKVYSLDSRKDLPNTTFVQCSFNNSMSDDLQSFIGQNKNQIFEDISAGAICSVQTAMGNEKEDSRITQSNSFNILTNETLMNGELIKTVDFESECVENIEIENEHLEDLTKNELIEAIKDGLETLRTQIILDCEDNLIRQPVIFVSSTIETIDENSPKEVQKKQEHKKEKFENENSEQFTSTIDQSPTPTCLNIKIEKSILQSSELIESLNQEPLERTNEICNFLNKTDEKKIELIVCDLTRECVSKDVLKNPKILEETRIPCVSRNLTPYVSPDIGAASVEFRVRKNTQSGTDSVQSKCKSSKINKLALSNSPSELKFDDKLNRQTKSGPSILTCGSYNKLMSEQKKKGQEIKQMQMTDTESQVLLIIQKNVCNSTTQLTCSNGIEQTPETVEDTIVSISETPQVTKSSVWFMTDDISGLFKIPMLANKVLSLLDTKDMLVGRQVCHHWFEAISHSTHFWKKTKVFKPMDFQVSWEEFQSSDLLSFFSCPNFHILRCDLREADAIDFLMENSFKLKYLILDQCGFSLATLQRILINCANLKYFEIIGFPKYIQLCEAIFPKGNHCPTHHTRLETLILNSDPDSYLSFQQNYENNVLSRGFIADFLNMSESLKSIHFIGWKSSTCMTFLNCLNSGNSNLERIDQIVFSKIPLDSLDFDHFIPLALSMDNIKLQKLELSLMEPQREYTRGRDYANLIIREIVRSHSQTLEELILDNCPLTEEVFIFRMPNLQKLSLLHTNISNTEFQRIMPKLKYLNHKIHTFYDSPNLTPVESQTYFGSSGIIFYKYILIYLIGIFCAMFFAIIYKFETESAGIAFFILAMCMFLAYNLFEVGAQ